jgi:enoyl-CoA hydratase/carnithine racemase
MPVEVSDRDGVWVLAVRRPPVNAIDLTLVREITERLRDAAGSVACRAVVVTGAGNAFSAGIDVRVVPTYDTATRAEMLRGINRMVAALYGLPKPTVAAINGHALGGGCEIAMGCHIRILKETARMGQTESNLGITPGFGGTQRYPRLMGRGLALEHLILGTQVSAQECYRTGLVNRLSKEGETLNDAKAMARELAKRPPIASRLIIEAVDDGIQAPIDQAIEIEVRAFEKVLKTEDAGEGIQAFFQKRPAQFKGN